MYNQNHITEVNKIRPAARLAVKLLRNLTAKHRSIHFKFLISRLLGPQDHGVIIDSSNIPESKIEEFGGLTWFIPSLLNTEKVILTGYKTAEFND